MKTVLILVLAIVLVSEATATETPMYRWRDANNQLHIGQIPPKDLPFETITVTEKLQSSPTLPAPNHALAKETAALQQSIAQRQRNCELAKMNVQRLAEDKPIYVQTEQGKSELLSKAQISEHQALAAQQVKYYCQQ